MKINDIDLANLFIGFGEFLKTYQPNAIESKKQVDKEFLTPEEVLEEYPFNPTSLYNAARYKGLAYTKTGKHRYYKRSDIELWLSNNTTVNGCSKDRFQLG